MGGTIYTAPEPEAREGGSREFRSCRSSGVQELQKEASATDLRKTPATPKAPRSKERRTVNA